MVKARISCLQLGYPILLFLLCSKIHVAFFKVSNNRARILTTQILAKKPNTRAKGALVSSNIRNLFQKSTQPESILSSLKKFVDDNADDLNHAHAVTILHKCSRAKIDVSAVVSLSFISSLMARESYPSVFTAREVSDAVFGIRSISPKSPGFDALIDTLIDRINGCSDKFNGAEIAHAFFGLQNLYSDQAKVFCVQSTSEHFLDC